MKMPSVMRGAGRFARVPTANIPRSSFNRSHGHKTTFDAGWLVPVYVDEVLPGDTFNLKMTAFARLSTPIKPLMDNLFLDSFFFFVPYRLVWENWAKLMGEQRDPGDSIAYTVPIKTTPGGGFGWGSLQDYMGLPPAVAPTSAYSTSALPIRAYFLIWNEWFRDQNLQDSLSHEGVSGGSWNPGDGPDGSSGGADSMQRRGKRHDYFTSCLPWAQKEDAAEIPLGDVISDGAAMKFRGPSSSEYGFLEAKASTNPSDAQLDPTGAGTWTAGEMVHYGNEGLTVENPNINEFREAMAIQKLLERDARSGTRYPEKIMAHFGVSDPSMAVLQRPEYLGGGSTPVTINPVAQTSATATAGAVDIDTEQGNLAGIGTAVARGHGFVKSFTEHGVIIGMVSVRADLNYQEGIERFWSRQTMYDFYFPAFANLGEQAVLNKELCVEGASTDDDAFGYQERWSEYKYKPSRITGEFRSAHSSTLEVWHLAQDYSGTCPTLDSSWIVEDPDMARVLASSSNDHFLFDSWFSLTCARPMPMYSIPGNMDRF